MCYLRGQRAEREYFGSTLLGAAGSAWRLVALRLRSDHSGKCRRHEGESRQHWSLRRSAIGELREQDDPGHPEPACDLALIMCPDVPVIGGVWWTSVARPAQAAA